MSQCYRVQLQASISRTVEAEDSVSYPLELTALLPEPEMRDLLASALAQQGWTADGRIFRRTGPSGEALELDLDTMTLTARLARQSEVVTDVEAVGRAESQTHAEQEARRLLQERGEAAGQGIAEAGKRTLQREVSAALAAGEDARRAELHGVLQQVYAEALKRKAGQLGNVMEVQEGTDAEGNYELSIRVEA